MADHELNNPNEKRTLTTCCGAHVIHDGLTDVLYVLLPVLAQTFGLSYTQIGLVRSAYRSALSLFQIPAGILAERWGERGLLALGTAFAGAAFIGLGMSSGFISLLIFLFLAGFGSAFQHPLCSSLVSRAYQGGGRRGALGTYNFAGDLGKFIFAWVVSLAIAAGLSWKIPVGGMGVMGVISAALIFIMLSRAGAGAFAADGENDSDSPRTVGWGIRDRRGFLALCALGILESVTRYGFLTFIAFLMIEKGASHELSTTVVPIVFIGGMAGKLACGFLADRIGVVRTIAVTVLTTGGGILVLLAAPLVAAFVLLPLIGVTINGTSSVLYGTVGEFVESDRQSRAYGLFYTLTTGSGVLAPLGYGALGDQAGISMTMGIIGFVIFLCLPMCVILRPSVEE
jgi:MFS family permease